MALMWSVRKKEDGGRKEAKEEKEKRKEEEVKERSFEGKDFLKSVSGRCEVSLSGGFHYAEKNPKDRVIKVFFYGK